MLLPTPIILHLFSLSASIVPDLCYRHLIDSSDHKGGQIIALLNIDQNTNVHCFIRNPLYYGIITLPKTTLPLRSGAKTIISATAFIAKWVRVNFNYFFDFIS